MVGIQRVDVVVIGGGLVGLLLANTLAHDNFEVALLEKRDIGNMFPDPNKIDDGRSSAIAFVSQQILEKYDLWGDLSHHAGPILDIRITDVKSPSFLHFDHKMMGSDPLGFMLPNKVMYSSFYKKLLARKNVKILSPNYYKTMATNAGQVRLELANGSEIQAPLCLAADGRHSVIRDKMGVPYKYRDYNQTAMIFTIKHEWEHQNVAWECFRKDGPFALLPLKDQHSTAVVWVETPEWADKLLKLDDAQLLQHMDLIMDGYLGKCVIASAVSAYPLKAYCPHSYGKDRIILMGDAAHAIHPIAGQGFNLTIRDLPFLLSVLTECRRLGGDLGSCSTISEYNKSRYRDNDNMFIITDILDKIFTSDILPVKLARRFGLGLINKLPFAQKFFMRYAMGVRGNACGNVV